MVAVFTDPVPRFWRRVERTNTCWLWGGALNPKGYGSIFAYGRIIPVHRFSYELAKGPIPEGMVIDHLCRTRNCVNPDHLEPTSNRENIMRGIGPSAKNAAKEACIRGHALSDDNVRPRGQTGRVCKTCESMKHAEYFKKRMAADPEKIRERQRAYRAANKEAIRENQRRYRAEKALRH